MNLDLIRASIAPYALLLKAGALVAAVLLVFAFGWNRGADKWQGKFDNEANAHKTTKAEHARVIRQLADQAKAVAAQAKAASVAAAAARKTHDQRYKDAKHEADRAKRDLRDALRRGTGAFRLQDHWTCAVRGSTAGGFTAAAGRQDAAADLRAAGAADLVAAGDHADNWIVWLQSELTSTRTACGATP